MILTAMTLAAGVGLWGMSGSASAAMSDPSSITINTINRTEIEQDVQKTLVWQLLPSLTPPIGPADARFNDLLSEVMAEPGSPINVSDYQQPFYFAGGLDFDDQTLVSLVGFDLSEVDLGMTSRPDQQVEVEPGKIEGVDYVTGGSSNPSDWVALTDVIVTVTNTTTETYHSSRTVYALVSPAAAPPVAAVPLPPAAWASAGLLGMLGVCRWIQRRGGRHQSV
ncbi:MAG: hypothetical protein IT446_02075 [Phycisphaerales bacterium]|nr:hypothetical protein [Phycisphaerales bacterium]